MGIFKLLSVTRQLTLGSVIAKHDLIFPSKSGRNQLSCVQETQRYRQSTAKKEQLQIKILPLPSTLIIIKQKSVLEIIFIRNLHWFFLKDSRGKSIFMTLRVITYPLFFCAIFDQNFHVASVWSRTVEHLLTRGKIRRYLRKKYKFILKIYHQTLTGCKFRRFHLLSSVTDHLTTILAGLWNDILRETSHNEMMIAIHTT